MREAWARHPKLGALTVAHICGFGLFGILNQRPAVAVYLVFMALAFAFVGKLDANTKFSTPVLVALSAWGFAHMAGGLIGYEDGVLYNMVIADPIRYDRLVHTFGFGAATVAVWQVLRLRVSITFGPVAVKAIVALAGMGLGAVNEVLEFAATLVDPTTNVGGYTNTGFDLIANLIGATIAATFFVHIEHPVKDFSPD